MGKKASTKDFSVRIDAQIRDKKKVAPTGVWFWKLAIQVVEFLPTYRNTREGRRVRQQVRVILLVLGIGMMAVGGQAENVPALWILLGVAIAASVFALPVEELKKRGWRSRLKKKLRPRRESFWRSGAVVFDDDRLDLVVDGERIRRVNMKRNMVGIVVGRRNGWTCLGVGAPPTGSKKSIWVCTEGDVDGGGDQAAEVPALNQPARVSANDWERLWESLQNND